MKHTITDLRLATASSSVWLKHKMKLRRFCSLVRSLRRTRNDHSITCLLKFLLYNDMAKLKRIIFRLQKDYPRKRFLNNILWWFCHYCVKFLVSGRLYFVSWYENNAPWADSILDPDKILWLLYVCEWTFYSNSTCNWFLCGNVNPE